MVAGEHNRDCTCEEGEERETNKLYEHAVKVFVCGASVDITVPNSGNGRQDEVKGTDIDGLEMIVSDDVLVAGRLLHPIYKGVHPTTFDLGV